MEAKIKKQNNYLKLGKISQKLLTFSVIYANMIVEVYWYSGIVVYFDGQKSMSRTDTLGHPNKKQKQKNRLGNSSVCQKAKIAFKWTNSSRSNQKWLISVSPTNQLISGLDQSAIGLSSQKKAVQSKFVFVILTFCFLSERFFVAFCKKIKSRKNKNKTKNQNYDRWILPATRHLAGNRSQQNHLDSLGRGRINSSSSPRLSGLALLHQRSSRRNHSTGRRNRLFSQGAWFVQKISRRTKSKLKRNCITNFKFYAGLVLLSFLNCKTPKYVLANTKSKYFYSLEKISNGISSITPFWSRQKTRFKYLINNLSQNDCWILQTTRYLARNRSQQNHLDSLGRGRINSSSSPRLSGLALLYQRSSRRNHSTGCRNQLLPRQRKFVSNQSPRSSQLNWYSIFHATSTAPMQIQLNLT